MLYSHTIKLIRYYKGLDGLKTGFTENAKYCLTATAERNGMRLISSVMGSETSELRSKDTIELMDYGFNNYKLKTVFNKNKELGTIKIKNGKKDIVKIKLLDDVTDLNTIEEENKYDYKIKIKNNKAPIKIGDIVGTLDLYKNKTIIKTINITVNENIEKAKYFDFYKKNIKSIISGNI